MKTPGMLTRRLRFRLAFQAMFQAMFQAGWRRLQPAIGNAKLARAR